MNYFLVSLNYVLMLIIALVVGVFIHRKTGAKWRYWVMGAVTFVVSQVFHIPFNWAVYQTGVLPPAMESWPDLLINALFLGLSAGVFEETARYLTYRFWAKDARSWSKGLMLGAGHGGIEAILVSVLAAAGLVSLLVTANSEAIMATLPEEQQAIVAQSIATMVDAPWYVLLLGAVERFLAILAHLAMSLMVLQVFLRRSIFWLFLAIGYHTMINAVAVITVTRSGPVTTEGLLALISLISLFVIFRLRTPEPEPVEQQPPLPSSHGQPLELDPTAEIIDRSRYT
jgi:uncharacterized membrane protein YhfC